MIGASRGPSLASSGTKTKHSGPSSGAALALAPCRISPGPGILSGVTRAQCISWPRPRRDRVDPRLASAASRRPGNRIDHRYLLEAGAAALRLAEIGTGQPASRTRAGLRGLMALHEAGP